MGFYHSYHVHSGLSWLPLQVALCVLPQNIVEQSHSSKGRLSVFSVWGLPGLGGCLFAQIAINTLLHPEQESSANTAFSKLPKAGMCIVGGFLSASARRVQVCVTGPFLLPRGLSLGASVMLLSCEPLA